MKEKHFISEGFNLELDLNNSLFSSWIDHVTVGNTQHITLKISVLRMLFIGIICTLIVIILFKSFLLIHICAEASRNLHNQIFESFLGFPKKFFSQNRPGYTMNIFSKDLATVDEGLPRSLMNTFGVSCFLKKELNF